MKAVQMWSWKLELTIIFNFFWHLIGINVPFSCRQDYQVSTFGAVLIRLMGLYSQGGYILEKYRHSMAYSCLISLLLELFYKAVFWKVTKGSISTTIFCIIHSVLYLVCSLLAGKENNLLLCSSPCLLSKVGNHHFLFFFQSTICPDFRSQ